MQENTLSISVAVDPPTDARPQLVQGTVIAVSRGFYEVEADQRIVTCTLRGRLRKELVRAERQGGRRGVVAAKQLMRDPVSPGDRVEILLSDDTSGVIERIHPRERAFERTDSGVPATGTQTLVAGIDQLVPVFSVSNPEPHLGMLDRFLVLAEAAGLATAVCMNKVDLGIEPALADRIRTYQAIGYPVVLTSVSLGEGIDELRTLLSGKTTALVGPSGVGKSSLVNAIEPNFDQRVQAISATSGKGHHTTTGTRLFPLSGPDGGYLADTAGLRALATTTVPPDELPECFPEFRPFLDRCRMPSCTHLREPGCAVRLALRVGKVDESRYRSYRRLRNGEEE